MASRYWVGGAGTWDGSNTVHWSATSGGTGGASVPTSADDVFFNGSSGTGTCTLSGAVPLIKSINFTSCSVTFTSSGIEIQVDGGNITLGSTANITSAVLELRPSTAISTTISGSATVSQITLRPIAASATASLASNVTVSDTFYVQGSAGTASLANFNVSDGGSTALIFDVLGTGLTATANLGSGTITCSSFRLPSDAATVTSSSVNIVGSSATLLSVYLYGRTVASVTCSTDIGMRWQTAGTTGSLTLKKTGSSVRSLQLYDTCTVTGLLTLQNTGTSTLSVTSSSAGTQRTLSAGSVSLSYVYFQDTAAAGAAIPFKGVSLRNNGNNTNIKFNSRVNGLFFGSNF